MKGLTGMFMLCLCVSISSLSQTIGGLSTDRLSRLDSIAIQDVPKGAPGIATGIVKNGKIVYEKTSGFADLTDSTLITKDSRFNIASNGKQFTALAVLMLLDGKQISLSDDIRKYLPSLYKRVRASITINHLLTHTSGIRDIYDLLSLKGITWWKESLGNKDVMALVEQQQELNFEPVAKFLYSNTNYILLAEIIEKVTGSSFESYTDEMFKKLGMLNTSFEPDHSKIKGPVAKAYFNFGNWTTYNWIWNVCGDGNLFSTLADQLRWEQILQGGIKSGVKRRIILKSQQVIKNSITKRYGYGIEFDKYKGLDYVFHEGATGAWKATVIRFPQSKISIITLTNTGKATPNTQTRQMADELFNLQSDSKYFVTKPATVGAFLAESDISGIYATENNFTFQFEKRDSAFYLKRVGRNDIKLERESANTWHEINDPAFKQEFKVNSKGEMEVTAYYTSHAPYTLTRANSNWNGFNYNLLNGKYLNTETNLIFEIRYTTGRTYDIKIGNKKTTTGVLVTPSKLLVNNYVVNIKNGPGGIIELLLNGDRIEKVRFSPN